MLLRCSEMSCTLVVNEVWAVFKGHNQPVALYFTPMCPSSFTFKEEVTLKSFMNMAALCFTDTTKVKQLAQPYLYSKEEAVHFVVRLLSYEFTPLSLTL